MASPYVHNEDLYLDTQVPSYGHFFKQSVYTKSKTLDLGLNIKNYLRALLWTQVIATSLLTQ